MSRNEKIRDLIYQYIRYGIIAVLVFVALVILPLFDTNATMGWEFPKTPLGWISYIVIRCLVGVITFLIFVSFHQQGKINILKDERYVNAMNKLMNVRDKRYIPESPQHYAARTYGFKAMSIAISSIITAFIVINCILNYNYSVLLAYALSIIMSVIFGIFQMMSASIWWTTEFVLWTDYYIEKIEKEKENEIKFTENS